MGTVLLRMNCKSFCPKLWLPGTFVFSCSFPSFRLTGQSVNDHAVRDDDPDDLADVQMHDGVHHGGCHGDKALIKDRADDNVGNAGLVHAGAADQNTATAGNAMFRGAI